MKSVDLFTFILHHSESIEQLVFFSMFVFNKNHFHYSTVQLFGLFFKTGVQGYFIFTPEVVYSFFKMCAHKCIICLKHIQKLEVVFSI